MTRGAVAKGFFPVGGGGKGSLVKLEGGISCWFCANFADHIDIAVRCAALWSCSISVAVVQTVRNRPQARCALIDSATTTHDQAAMSQLWLAFQSAQ
jgi:hypothetical protein